MNREVIDMTIRYYGQLRDAKQNTRVAEIGYNEDNKKDEELAMSLLDLMEEETEWRNAGGFDGCFLVAVDDRADYDEFKEWYKDAKKRLIAKRKATVKQTVKLSDDDTVKEVKKAANDMQETYNHLNETSYTWNVKSVEENRVVLVWSYLDVELVISMGEDPTGDMFVKSYDPSMDRTVRYYLIGNEFYHDYKDLLVGLITLVRNSVQVMNGIY